MNSKDLSQILRKQWGIDPYSPINILNESLEHLKNLTILWMPLKKEIKGCCSKNKTDFLIILNSTQDLGNQNFTLAHELYHLLFEKSDEWIICSDDENTESEKNANIFASHLLLPEASLYAYGEKNNIKKWKIENMISCEQYFQISHEVLSYRLKNSDLKLDSINHDDLVKKSKIQGYDGQLYSPSLKKYYSLGNYIKLTEKAFKNDKFSIGKRNELLKSVFRSDIIDEF
ncbi:ImmA/IrrE family metallo-endopeptidase [uncultured Methanobrevibacter sp.]|uniref:ImmA/IrrE family metallo-endopeptidase n=1 Tax=uncultured Methanobrevibacter sp. TaxID=253161 RepID=UPI002627E6A2|nr:ImmA/IrrE family metallo-endopeptidase [uncultured Methanobrevibacter sp.]